MALSKCCLKTLYLETPISTGIVLTCSCKRRMEFISSRYVQGRYKPGHWRYVKPPKEARPMFEALREEAKEYK